MADEPLLNEDEDNELSVVVIRVGARWFGVPAELIREILVKGPITRVPFTPTYMLGLCMVHGRVVPVFTLGEHLGVAPGGPTATRLPRLVVLQTATAEIAVSCEEASGVFTVARPELCENKGSVEAGRTQWGELEITMIDVVRLVQLVLAHTGGNA